MGEDAKCNSIIIILLIFLESGSSLQRGNEVEEADALRKAVHGEATK